MARFYRIKPCVNEYDNLVLVEENEHLILKILYFLGDMELADKPQHWEPVDVAIEKNKNRTDFPGFSGAGFHIVLSEKSKNILLPLIVNNVEFFPLRCISNENYYAIRTVKIIDCIDYSQSLIEKYSTGKFRKFTYHKFIESKIGDNHIFRIPEINRPIVSQTFKNVVEENKLQGLIFQDRLS